MNKLKLKRIIIVASFIIIMMTSILKYPSSFASSNANLYLVFVKTTYNVGRYSEYKYKFGSICISLVK